MARLIFIFLGLALTSCSVQPITEGRTKRNAALIVSLTADILRMNANKFLVDTVAEKTIKKKLKKVNAATVEIFKGEHYELAQDSVIVLSRHNFMLTFGEIVIDFKKGKARDLTGIGGLKKIGKGIYFRKRTLSIS